MDYDGGWPLVVLDSFLVSQIWILKCIVSLVQRLGRLSHHELIIELLLVHLDDVARIVDCPLHPHVLR